MAEERLIDEDKDRKYKIRINEDGEEELVLVEQGEEEEEDSDIPVFDIPVYEEDDEEAAVLTPEQLAERDRLKEEAEKRREETANAYIKSARQKLDEGDFASALDSVTKAEELEPNNGEVYCLALKTLTRNFTEYNLLEDGAKAADGVRDFANEQQKAELRALASGLKQKISDAEITVSELGKENEAKKAERREAFAIKKTHDLITLILASVSFAMMLIVTIVFSTMMFAAENGAFLIATIVTGALTLIAFICTLIAANRFWTAQRHVVLNEKDASTQLGRDYVKNKTELELLKRIYNSFNDDLS